MPFTAAHPAIVLPLSRLFKSYVSLTALIIGSVTPDFEYFLRMDIKSVYSHTPLGILYFDLPVGLLLFILYQTYIKHVLINYLPYYLKQRFLISFDNQFAPLVKRWILIIISLIIGVVSHLFWDAFTHQTGWFVSLVSFLTRNDLGIPNFKLAQHLSTLIGLLAIIYYIKLLPITTVTKLNINKFWRSYTLIFLGIFLIRIIFLYVGQRPHFGIGLLIVSAISAGLLALLLKCIFHKVFVGKTQK